MMQWKVQLFKLNYDEREYNAVMDTLKSGWITMGQRTIDFEEAYAQELGEGTKCLAVSNGTAALHIAVLACGIKPGDEVIVPSLTFIADLNSVRVSGAEVVIADVTSMEDWGMNPADIEAKITPRTKAVMIVHYAGYACDMDAIVDICKRHNLKLIEDCAHANGGTYKGRKLGTFGDVSAWSFFSNKNLAVGEGGMVATRDPELYQKCKNLRSHGMTVASFDRMKGRATSYDVLEPGFNYRIDEVRASLGLVQLAKLPEANAVLVRSAGTMRRMRSLEETWDLKAACVAAGLLYRGVAKAVGMDVYDVEGANGLLNTNIQGKVSKALELLDSYDFVYLHLKGTDVASHSKNPVAKYEFIKRFYESLRLIDDSVLNTTTIVITGDHTTPCDRGMHTGEPVPILIASKSLRSDATKVFSEREAAYGGLGRIRGCDVMPILLDSIERTVEYGTRPSPRRVNYMPKRLTYLSIKRV